MSKKIDSINLPPGYDRRIKLTPEDREDIVNKHKQGFSTRELAREYVVDRGLIRQIHDKAYRDRQKELYKARREDGRYKEPTEKRRVIMREYRAHKRKALLETGICTLDKRGRLKLK